MADATKPKRRPKSNEFVQDSPARSLGNTSNSTNTPTKLVATNAHNANRSHSGTDKEDTTATSPSSSSHNSNSNNTNNGDEHLPVNDGLKKKNSRDDDQQHSSKTNALPTLTAATGNANASTNNSSTKRKHSTNTNASNSNSSTRSSPPSHNHNNNAHGSSSPSSGSSSSPSHGNSSSSSIPLAKRGTKDSAENASNPKLAPARKPSSSDSFKSRNSKNDTNSEKKKESSTTSSSAKRDRSESSGNSRKASFDKSKSETEKGKSDKPPEKSIPSKKSTGDIGKKTSDQGSKKPPPKLPGLKLGLPAQSGQAATKKPSGIMPLLKIPTAAPPEEEAPLPPDCSGFVQPGEIMDDRVCGISRRFLSGYAETVGGRNNMEDKLVLYGNFRPDQPESSDYFAVFDGHNGDSCAAYCAVELHNILSRQMDVCQNPTVYLKAAFQECNRELELGKKGGGTTAVVALFLERELWVANAGDSRAVICRNRKAQRITVDHKPHLPKERERIVRSGGTVMNGRVTGTLTVSRALGDNSYKPHVICDPDVFGPFECIASEEYQLLILACDGLWDVVDDEEAVQIALNCKDPHEAAVELRETARQKMSRDNISVLVVFCPNYKPPITSKTTTKKPTTNSTSSTSSTSSTTTTTTSTTNARPPIIAFSLPKRIEQKLKAQKKEEEEDTTSSEEGDDEDDDDDVDEDDDEEETDSDD